MCFNTDLVLTNSGSHASPPSDVLRNNQAMLSLNLDGKITNLKGLNIIYLVKTTVHLCNDPDLLWDPRKDLLWLCRKYGKEIQTIRGQLDARQVQENFLGTPYFFTLSADEQRLCYHVLIGKDPPPGLYLIPAPKVQSASTRPSIQGSKSAPSLKESIQQQQSGFLRPPMPHKMKTMPATSSHGPIMQDVPQPLPKNGISGSTGDSQGKCRNSSAPSASNGNHNVGPKAHPKTTGMASMSDYMHRDNRIYQAQKISIQNLSLASKPHVVHTKKSLPRVAEHQTTTTQAVPVFAHKPSSTYTAPQKHVQGIPVAISIRPGTEPQPQNQVLEAHDNNSMSQSAANAQPHTVAHTHPAHKIVAQRHSMIPRTNTTTTTTDPVPFFEEMGKSNSPSKGLSVIGSEGLYPKPPKPDTHVIETPSTTSVTQTISTSFAFELDAISPQIDAFPSVAAATEFVAELPANEDASLPLIPPEGQRSNSPPMTPVSPPQMHAQLISPTGYRDSPVSPPTTYRPLDLLVRPLAPEASIGSAQMVHTLPAPTSKPSPSPPSFDALPPSLMIGFRGPSQSVQANTESRSRASSQCSNGSDKPVVLNKYQRYYSPPLSRETSPNSGSTSAPASRKPSPNRGHVYKAYTPPITPPLYPKAEAEVSTSQHPPKLHHRILTPPTATTTADLATSHIPPVRMQRASVFIGPSSSPAALKAGIPQPLKSTKAPLPNPLASNPPTPRIAYHTKHDSHQDYESHGETCGNDTPTFNDNVHQDRPEAQIAYSSLYERHFMPTQKTQYIPFSTKLPSPSEPPQLSSFHQRNASKESNTSTTSHDSEKLAHEYQLGLPSFERDYAEGEVGYMPAHMGRDAQTKRSHRPSYAGTGYDF